MPSNPVTVELIKEAYCPNITIHINSELSHHSSIYVFITYPTKTIMPPCDIIICGVYTNVNHVSWHSFPRGFPSVYFVTTNFCSTKLVFIRTSFLHHPDFLSTNRDINNIVTTRHSNPLAAFLLLHLLIFVNNEDTNLLASSSSSSSESSSSSSESGSGEDF